MQNTSRHRRVTKALKKTAKKSKKFLKKRYMKNGKPQWKNIASDSMKVGIGIYKAYNGMQL